MSPDPTRTAATRPGQLLGRFLRRPALVVVELALLALAMSAAAGLPQHPEEERVVRFAAEWPWLGRLTASLGLHDVTTSPAFLALVGLATCSLVAVQLEQWRRVRRTYAGAPSQESLRKAPFRQEFQVGEATSPPASPRLWRQGRLGMLGSPIFHLGLLVVVGAGLMRALTYSAAAVQAYEGQVLGAGAVDLVQPTMGLLGRPFELPGPIRLERLVSTRYQSGSLLGLEAELTLLGDGERHATIAINAPLDLSDSRTLYLLQEHGVSAFLIDRLAGQERPRALELTPVEEQLRGGFRGEEGWEVRLWLPRGDGPPAWAEVRVLRQGALLAMGRLAPGATLALGPGASLELRGFTRWARFKGSRDPSLPAFLVGLVTALCGVLLMFGVVTVDAGVFQEGGRLVVAMRPHRFAPLFTERFEQLCKEWTT